MVYICTPLGIYTQFFIESFVVATFHHAVMCRVCASVSITLFVSVTGAIMKKKKGVSGAFMRLHSDYCAGLSRLSHTTPE